MELGPRDRLSQAFWYEQQKGRTIEHPARLGGPPRPAPPRRSLSARASAADLRTGRKFWVSIRPRRRSRCVRACTTRWAVFKVDGNCAHRRCRACTPCGRMLQRRHPRRQPPRFELAVRTAGLRQGGRRRSGAFAKSVAPGNSASLLKQAQGRTARHGMLKTKTGGTERIADMRKEMAQTMEDGCGIYRLGKPCRRPATSWRTARALQERQHRGQVERLEHRMAAGHRTGYQLDVAQSMAHSAINRKESRGAHQRLDGFEQRDDVNFLKHSQAHYVAGRRTAHRLRRCQDHQVPARPAPTAQPAKGAEQERKASHV
jgi:fumarate reductase flavoprotein subunit